MDTGGKTKNARQGIETLVAPAPAATAGASIVEKQRMPVRALRLNLPLGQKVEKVYLVEWKNKECPSGH